MAKREILGLTLPELQEELVALGLKIPGGTGVPLAVRKIRRGL